MGRLFGTDGARGVANRDLTCELAMNIGRAAATVLTKHLDRKPRVIIGKDTRISSDMLEGALIAGLCSVGADVLLGGVLPTPAVAFLTGPYQADAGIMISASHNPVEYNGIKLFNGAGYKLLDSLEAEIETLVLDRPDTLPAPTGAKLGTVRDVSETAAEDYIAHLAGTIGNSIKGMRVAVDCANGSACATAPGLFARLGVDAALINAQPNGVNINDRCGSTHMEGITSFVRENGFEIGIAYDGDADRCLMVDRLGHTIDGDKLMGLAGRYFQKKGRLPANTIVATVMSNLGLFAFARQNGIQTVTTQVGDRYVLEEMLKHGYVLGGEQSGHVIFLDYATTGDGQLTALQILSILRESKIPLHELASQIETFPQVMVNVRIANAEKERFSADPILAETVRREEEKLGDSGRVLVRLSGTEPLVRVMVEAKDEKTARHAADTIAKQIQERYPQG